MTMPKLSTLIGSLWLALLLSSCQEAVQTQVEEKDIVDAVFASGFIAMEDEYLVMANTEAQILRQLVQEGDAVLTGMPLFKLSQEVQSAQLATAQANYEDAQRKAAANSPQLAELTLKIEQAESQLQQDRKNYERYQQLVTTHAVSQLEFEQAKMQYENAQNSLARLQQSLVDLESSLQLNLENAAQQLRIQQENSADHVITSAIEGRVLTLMKQQGELVRRGEALAKVGGGEAIVKLYVAEEDINLVEVGQTAYVALNTAKDDRHAARISKIYPAFDEQQQSFIVEAVFVAPPTTLYPGTRLQANIVVGKKENALVIPAEFLLPGDSVMLADRSLRPIEVGMRSEAWVEVASGLQKGNTVIVKP